MGKFILILILFALFSFWCARKVLKKPGSKAASFILVIWSVCLALLFLETYFRFFYVKSDAFGLLGENFSKKYYKKDKWKFRDSGMPFSKEKPNIIILGDSFVFGHGLKQPEDRYSNILRDKLPNFHVINMSKSGASTRDELHYLLKHYQGGTQTDLVILNYVFNDIEDEVPKKQQYRKKSPQKIIQLIMKYSELAKHLYFRLIYPMDKVNHGHIQMLTKAYNSPELLQTHRRMIQILKYSVENLYQAKLVVILWPYLQHLEPSVEYDTMLDIFRQLDIPTINLLEYFKTYDSKKLMVSLRDPHPNRMANQLVADIVFQHITADTAKQNTVNTGRSHPAGGCGLLSESPGNAATVTAREPQRAP